MIRIQTAQKRDIEHIARIEQSFPSPWSRELIEKEFSILTGLRLVACQDIENNIVGWCCARIIPPEAELLKITVCQSLHRQGTGSSLINKLWSQLMTANCTSLFLEVREKNHRAISFYTKHGFHQAALRKNYYTSPTDNGIIMIKKTKSDNRG